MNGKPHILVFDSGVGGLSIVESIRQHLPDVAISYGSDNEAFPYGTKPEAELTPRVIKVLRAFCQVVMPDIIVIACNSASTVALAAVREVFSQPVVGVVPAIKPAALQSQTKVIGLLATPGTIARPYTHQLIQDFAVDCDVIRVGSSELVEQAEGKLRGDPVNLPLLEKLLSPLFFTDNGARTGVDTIVLACTHFPLLQQELASASPTAVSWLDSGQAIARRVAHLSDACVVNTTRPTAILFTANTTYIKRLYPALEHYLSAPCQFIRC